MQAPRTAPHPEKFLLRQEVTEQDWSKAGDYGKEKPKNQSPAVSSEDGK